MESREMPSVTRNLKESNNRIKSIVEQYIRGLELKFIQHLEDWEKQDKLIQKLLKVLEKKERNQSHGRI